MGNYNTLSAPVVCPRCGTPVNAEIEVRFGDTSKFVTLNIGDTVPWASGRLERNGGRPEGGNMDGEGYMECPNCRKDSLLIVSIRDDVVSAVKRDPSKAPYIPD